MRYLIWLLLLVYGFCNAAEIDNTAATLLGKRLFLDPRLSGTGSRACASCHKPDQGFTDNAIATATGIDGKPLPRNAPDLFNVASRPELYWDGRQPDAALQVLEPLVHPNEMGNPSVSTVVNRLAKLEYNTQFAQIYGALTAANLADALLRYEISIMTAPSPFERWYFDGNVDAVSENAKRGFGIFVRHGCLECHTVESRQFTDHDFHNTGVEKGADLGRFVATGRRLDRFRFRTPSLRNVSLTSPYMHDGSENTLTDVIRFYMRGPANSAPASDATVAAEVDQRLLPFVFNQTEIDELIAFLASLTTSEP